MQIEILSNLKSNHSEHLSHWVNELQTAAIQNKNIFETLMEAGKYCSLGQVTKALFEVGGQYRRNM